MRLSDIRQDRSEVLSKFSGLQVGANGILGDYINSFTTVRTWLSFLSKHDTDGERFQNDISELGGVLSKMEKYEDWELFHREMDSGDSLINHPDTKRVLFDMDDVEPIIEALNKNVAVFRDIGKELEGMTIQRWQEQEVDITQRITSLVTRQRSLLQLGLGGEVNSLEDIRDLVNDILES